MTYPGNRSKSPRGEAALYGAYAMFTLATAHGLGAGTDATNPAILGTYGIAIVSVYALTVYRILMTARKPQAVMARAR